MLVNFVRKICRKLNAKVSGFTYHITLFNSY